MISIGPKLHYAGPASYVQRFRVEAEEDEMLVTVARLLGSFGKSRCSHLISSYRWVSPNERQSHGLHGLRLPTTHGATPVVPHGGSIMGRAALRLAAGELIPIRIVSKTTPAVSVCDEYPRRSTRVCFSCQHGTHFRIKTVEQGIGPVNETTKVTTRTTGGFAELEQHKNDTKVIFGACPDDESALVKEVGDGERV